ncbi:MAG: hypothetical protein EYC70_09315 [Planctomycetota bacterium]|nr:MAG: hypothetical protein EYC70_09315 [Planctomycetota bacterium]
MHANAFAGGYAPALSGRLKTTSTTASGTLTGEFDLEQVGQGAPSLSPAAEIRLGTAPLELAFSGFQYAETGDGSFNGFYLGEAFDGAVQSDFEVRGLRGTVGVDLLNGPAGRLGVLVGAHYFEMDLRLTDVSSGATTALNEKFPVPVLGVRADIQVFPALRIGGELTGMSVDVDDYDATFYDAQVAAHWNPIDPLEAIIGYRATSLDFKGPIPDSPHDLDATLEFTGPFFGVGLTF